MTLTLAQREDILVALLRDRFPGHRVRGSMGTPADARKLEVIRPPELHVALGAWEPPAPGRGQSAGTHAWTVRVVDAALRSPAARRREGIYAAVELLRAALDGAVLAQGHSPLVARGGRLLSAGEPWAVWEEQFAESAPAAGDIRPLLAATIEQIGVLPAPIEAGSSIVPLNGFAVEADDILLLEDLDADIREWSGSILSVGLDGAATEREFVHDFPAGSLLWRAEAFFRLPVTPTPGDESASLDNARTEHDLAGGAHKALLGEPRTRRETTFAPILLAHAGECLAFLAAHRATPSLLFGAPDGLLHQAEVALPRVVPQSARLASLALSLLTRLPQALDAWEAPA